MINIITNNGELISFKSNEYDDYSYDGKCFLIIKDGTLTNLFNINAVNAIKIIKEQPAATPLSNFNLGNFMNPPVPPNDEPLPAEEDEKE